MDVPQRRIEALVGAIAIVHQGDDLRLGPCRRDAADQSIARRVHRWPEAKADAGQNGCAIRRSLVRGGVDRLCVDVSLNLTPERRARSAAAQSNVPDWYVQFSKNRQRVAQA